MKPEYPNTPYQRWLAAHYACEDAREWIGDKAPEEAWLACPRADWLLWQVARCNPPEELRPALVTLAQGFAARTARKVGVGTWEWTAGRVARAASAAMAASADAAEMAEMADEVRSALPPVLPKLNEE